MLFLIELLIAIAIAIAFFTLILEEIGVSIVNHVVVMVKVLETRDVAITILKTVLCFAHTRVEWLDERLAGELDSVIEASDVVGFLKGVLEFVEGSYLDVI
jgi:hypothetical protein